MSKVITVIYKDGVLEPLTPLKLQENQTLQIQILPEGEPISAEAALQRLVEAGRLTPPKGHPPNPPFDEAHRRQLADELGRVPGKSLSQLIIEERDEQ